MLAKKLVQIFDRIATPDKALERAVKARDLERVRNAFARAASPDALSLVKYSSQRAIGVSSGKCLEPVILLAVKKSSLEVVEEILKHAPDLGQSIWCEQGGVKGFLPTGLLEKIAQHAARQVRLNVIAGYDAEADKKFAAVRQYALTAKWPFQAADHGDNVAQHAMGSLYSRYSNDAARDYIQAYKWYSLTGDAKATLDWLEKKMTSEQISEAKTLAAGWQPSSTPPALPKKEP